MKIWQIAAVAPAASSASPLSRHSGGSPEPVAIGLLPNSETCSAAWPSAPLTEKFRAGSTSRSVFVPVLV